MEVENKPFHTDHFKNLILKRLNQNKDELKLTYLNNQKKLGIGFVAIDHLLPHDQVLKISKAFDEKLNIFRRMDSFREKKRACKQFQLLDPILGEITFAFQDPEVVSLISEITGIHKQIPDDKLYAGGLSVMSRSDFLDPHIDNSHDLTRKFFRRLNLLYYVSENWRLENGGHLELWNDDVTYNEVIPSYFNRLVLMETHKRSWHSVSEVKADGFRKCVSNYYFSEESPTKENYFHVTSFLARPEQPVKRALCHVDNFLRSAARKLKPTGFGQVDIFDKNRK